MTLSSATLAATNWPGLFVVVLGVAFAIGGTIVNALKELRKKRAAQERRMQQEFSFGSLDAGQVERSAPSVTPIGRVSPGEQDARTAAQRIEQARAMYAQRLEAIRQQRNLPTGQQQQTIAEAEARRRAQAQQAHLAQQRANAQRLQAQQAPQRRQQQQRQAPQARPPAQPPKRQPAPQAPTPAAPSALAAAKEAMPTTRALSGPAAGHRPIPALAGRSLREAFIWREILDRPLALRTPNEPL